MARTHILVLVGGGYTLYATHEAEPVATWIEGLGYEAGVIRYPLGKGTPCRSTRSAPRSRPADRPTPAGSESWASQPADTSPGTQRWLRTRRRSLTQRPLPGPDR
jgi:hypothetical protein